MVRMVRMIIGRMIRIVKDPAPHPPWNPVLVHCLLLLSSACKHVEHQASSALLILGAYRSA